MLAYTSYYTRPKLRTLGPIEYSKECPPTQLEPGTTVKSGTWVLEVFPEELKSETNPYGVGDSFGCVVVSSDTTDLDVCWCDGQQQDIPMKYASICPDIGATVHGTTRRLTVKRYWKKGIGCMTSYRRSTDAKTADAANKTTDAVNKTTDAVKKTTDAVNKTTDDVNKTTDAVNKTTDAAKKRKSAQLQCEPAAKKKKATKTKDHTPAQGTPPKRPTPPDGTTHWWQRKSPEKPRPKIVDMPAYNLYLKYDAQANMMRENPEMFQQFVSVACVHTVYCSSP